MSKKTIFLTISIALVVIIGLVIYNITNNKNEEIGLNENTENLVEMSQKSEDLDEPVTDECLDEWDDYNQYVSEKIEEASNNLTEKDTHYLLKDVYGYIEVYYLEDNQEYLYKKTSISTDYLSDEDREDLKVGIEVVGAEALNKMLEDFE